MFSGRGNTFLAGSAAFLAVALVPAVTSADPVVQVAKKKKPPVRLVKGRVTSDGTVIPGQQETIAVSKMPPRTRLQVFVEPPPTTPQCGQYYFCRPVRVFPVPGTPAYRSSGKGGATLSFVMPHTYVIQSDPFKPSTRQTVTWVNGQSVHLDVLGQRKTRKVRQFGFGFGRSIVSIPPA